MGLGFLVNWSFRATCESSLLRCRAANPPPRPEEATEEERALVTLSKPSRGAIGELVAAGTAGPGRIGVAGAARDLQRALLLA